MRGVHAASVLPCVLRMRRPWQRGLHVEVGDDELVVSLPRSHYSVTYYKPENSPQLLAKRISDRDDPRAPMTASEFLAKAWKLANDKARELGWIV
jgi:hypothetical protein